jgi:protein gp37
MSDLYHRDVPLSFIAKVFGVMHQINWHRYQILTKRAERLAACRNKHVLKCTCCFCWPIRMLFACERIISTGC